MEDAGLLHDVEDLLRLGRGPRERLRAEDALARPRGGRDRLLVEVVGQPDHHDVHVRGEDRLVEARRPPRDPPLLREGLRLHGVAALDDHDPVPAPLAVEAHRVEEADEARTEHRDVRHVALSCPLVVGCTPPGPAAAGL